MADGVGGRCFATSEACGLRFSGRGFLGEETPLVRTLFPGAPGPGEAQEGPAALRAEPQAWAGSLDGSGC